MILNKVNKTIGLLRKLYNILPKSAVLTVYKVFVRPHIDYSNIIYDQAYNANFHQKLELVQYNACLALTGAMIGTSKEKFYEELSLKSLQHRRLYRKLSYFYKFHKNQFPQYLFKLIPVRGSEYSTRSMQNIPFFKTRYNCFFKKMFFPVSHYTIK